MYLQADSTEFLFPAFVTRPNFLMSSAISVTSCGFSAATFFFTDVGAQVIELWQGVISCFSVCELLVSDPITWFDIFPIAFNNGKSPALRTSISRPFLSFPSKVFIK